MERGYDILSLILEACFIPFVFEDGGRPSFPALHWIDMIFGLDKVVRGGANRKLAAERRVLLAHIQTIIALSNLELVRLFRANWRPAPGNGVLLRKETRIAIVAPPPEQDTGGREEQGTSKTTNALVRVFREQGPRPGKAKAADFFGPSEEPKSNGEDEAPYVEADENVFSRRYAELGADAITLEEGPVEKCKCKQINCSTTGTDICENAQRKHECNERTCSAYYGCENKQIQKQAEEEIVEVAEEQGAGRKGLRAKKDLQKGAFCGEFVGKIAAEADTTTPECCPFAPILKFAHARGSSGAERSTPTVLDARRVGNNTRFIAPSCDPNCEAVVWWVLRQPRMALRTLRPVKEGEFLTLSHAQLKWDKRWCGSCRKEKTRGSRGPLVVYTDGSWRAGAKDAVAGWAAVFVERFDSLSAAATDKEVGIDIADLWGAVDVRRNSPFFGGAQVHTNNTGEFTAILEALLWFATTAIATP